MDNVELVMSKVEKYKIPFQNTFGTPLQRFVSPMFCMIGIFDFDITRFDDWMHTRGYDEKMDGSLKNYIDKKYGIEATKMISELINIIE